MTSENESIFSIANQTSPARMRPNEKINAKTKTVQMKIPTTKVVIPLARELKKVFIYQFKNNS
jgi:hypothetical protein